MSAAREAVLARIRRALRDVPDDEQLDAVVERGYRTTVDSSAGERLELLAERLTEYRAIVHRVEHGGIAGVAEEAVRARGLRRVLVPADLPAAWRPAGVQLVSDDGLTHRDLDRTDGVLTGCAVAIAGTGTIALDGGAGQGRRAITLVPDYHLCVVRAEQIVMTVPEGIAALREAAVAGRPITLISGPSATSDIELDRVEGVHGPRTLEVLLAESKPA